MRTSDSQRGFNLVEVLIAMALLAVVLLSIFTLFVMGRRNVYSGKQLTQANAIGRNVLEDLSSMTISDVRSTFGIANNEALGNVDVSTTTSLPDETYAGAILRSTMAISAATDPRGYMQSWQDQIVNQQKLGDGYVALVIRPANPAPVGATLTPANATVMQIRVIVRWVEGARPRQAIFDTSKVQRP